MSKYLHYVTRSVIENRIISVIGIIIVAISLMVQGFLYINRYDLAGSFDSNIYDNEIQLQNFHEGFTRGFEADGILELDETELKAISYKEQRIIDWVVIVGEALLSVVNIAILIFLFNKDINSKVICYICGMDSVCEAVLYVVEFIVYFTFISIVTLLLLLIVWDIANIAILLVFALIELIVAMLIQVFEVRRITNGDNKVRECI